VDSCDAEQFAADLNTYKGIESVSCIHIASMTFTRVLLNSCTVVVGYKDMVYMHFW